MRRQQIFRRIIGIAAAVFVGLTTAVVGPALSANAAGLCGPSNQAWPADWFEAAFQANTSNLFTVGSAANADWRLGMMPGTSPAIAYLPGGGFEVAFQANTGNLWTVGSAGCRDWQLGMMTGTSPAITGLAGGGYQVAFQANTGSLWTVGSAAFDDLRQGMLPGTSPAITGLTGGGYEIAFQANTTSLITVGTAGNTNWRLGMMTGTSPGISGLAGGGYQVAFQANTGSLWTVGSAAFDDLRQGMLPGTSPAITGLTGGGYEIAFQANTTSLITVGTAGNTNWRLGMARGTGPAISPLPGGSFKVAFQANTTSLYTGGPAGWADTRFGMLPGTSPGITSPGTVGTSGFSSSISGIDGALAARMRSSWRAGCPVPLSDLRYLTVTYRGFDGADHSGELVVAASASSAVVDVFRRLYGIGYPVASMRLVDDFGGSDDQSMAANNTSAFNCRAVTGGGGFSEHSYGTAIDLNPVQNPYVSGGSVLPEQGRPYLGRPSSPGVIHAGDAVVNAFAQIGWKWGGSWSSPIDYQHFSASGR